MLPSFVGLMKPRSWPAHTHSNMSGHKTHQKTSNTLLSPFSIFMHVLSSIHDTSLIWLLTSRPRLLCGLVHLGVACTLGAANTCQNEAFFCKRNCCISTDPCFHRVLVVVQNRTSNDGPRAILVLDCNTGNFFHSRVALCGGAWLRRCCRDCVTKNHIGRDRMRQEMLKLVSNVLDYFMTLFLIVSYLWSESLRKFS